MIETAVRFFQEGGFFMYPIAIVLIIGLIVAAERYIYLSAQKITNRRDFNRLHHMIGGKDLKGALNYATESGSAMASMIGFGLQRLARRQSREEIEYAMEEGLLEVMPRLEKRTQYLSTLANISTLMGLLGTIIGLIAAFTAVAAAGPVSKGEPAVPEYLRSDEHDGLRPDVCDPAAVDPLSAPDQDQRNHRQLRDGRHQGAEPDHRRNRRKAAGTGCRRCPPSRACFPCGQPRRVSGVTVQSGS